MIYAGNRPGAGSYECDNCAEVMILTDSADQLPPCPYCNNSMYLTISADIDGKHSGAYQYDLYHDEPVEDTVKRFFSGYF